MKKNEKKCNQLKVNKLAAQKIVKWKSAIAGRKTEDEKIDRYLNKVILKTRF